jgi:hypothetical protein
MPIKRNNSKKSSINENPIIKGKNVQQTDEMPIKPSNKQNFDEMPLKSSKNKQEEQPIKRKNST